MRINKKLTTVLAFSLGAMMFVTTAFADMALGSGYDGLKNSMKRTAGHMGKDIKNYTMETLITVEDNGKPLMQTSNYSKVDNEKSASENSIVNQYASGKTTTHYSYSDKTLSIWKNEMEEDKYYVTEYKDGPNKFAGKQFTNPFEQKGADEIEKIFDALVGNLKNYVQVEEKAEGGREYKGSLAEAEVPALVNAVSSFLFKQQARDNRMRDDDRAFLPEIESDIFIKNITGKALENKDGILESASGEATLVGKDKNGVGHELSFKVTMKLSDVDRTVIVKPDLTGKKIEKVSQSGRFGSKYIGKYKSEIVIEKDDKFVKAGERIIEITSVDDKKVTGRYYETCKPGFEAEMPDRYDFTFEFNPDDPMSVFTYTNPAGEKEQGQLHEGGNGKLYLNMNIEVVNENSIRSKSTSSKFRMFDGQFSRVFEE